MITNNIVPFDLLKMYIKKDFKLRDEEAFALYTEEGILIDRRQVQDWQLNGSHEEHISAPFYAQLIEWLQEKHHIYIEVRPYNDTSEYIIQRKGYCVNIVKYNDKETCTEWSEILTNHYQGYILKTDAYYMGLLYIVVRDLI
jgi:hypothetical protein